MRGCGDGPSTLALFTRRSMPPSSVAAATRSARCAASATSPGMARTGPDGASCSAATRSAAGSRASMTRFQPSAASDRASSRPRPREAPVMIATGIVFLLVLVHLAPAAVITQVITCDISGPGKNENCPRGSALELECAVGDDVLLHLGRTRADRGVALPHVVPGPHAAVDRSGRALEQRARRSEHIERELREPQRDVPPLELRERNLGPTLLTLQDLRQRAHDQQAGRFDLNVQLRDALPD